MTSWRLAGTVSPPRKQGVSVELFYSVIFGADRTDKASGKNRYESMSYAKREKLARYMLDMKRGGQPKPDRCPHTKE
jgi:hypothetical protein